MMVMYGGLFIEEADVKDLYANPQHPYTLGLLGSLPRMDGKHSERLVAIDGLPPVLYAPPTSCPFAPRCKFAIERCSQENPKLEEVSPKHKVACWVDTRTGRSR
jgi:oligopeptide transport system ATP-binding protein